MVAQVILSPEIADIKLGSLCIQGEMNLGRISTIKIFSLYIIGVDLTVGKVVA